MTTKNPIWNAGAVAFAATLAATTIAVAGEDGEGRKLYEQNCSACHGMDAEGVPSMGKDLTTSEFFADKSDEDLVEFVKEGRGVDHPDNTRGIPMPPKAGNPALTEEQIEEIIEYLRGLRES